MMSEKSATEAPEVTMMIEMVGTRSFRLVELAEQLTSKLSPVLRDIPSENQNTINEVASKKTPLGRNLQETEERLSQAIEQLTYLMKNIEV